jgi:hypothetical protein
MTGRRNLAKASTEDLLHLKQTITVAREKAEAGFLTKLEPINAELDRRALVSRFSETELVTLREALTGG